MLKKICSIALVTVAIGVNAQHSNGKKPGQSEWVFYKKDILSYKTLPTGDRIMDFSYAGYMGGGLKLPSPPVKITLTALPGDNTDAIQNAINEVSHMQIVNGFRGTVLLKPGTYNCDRTLNITASGVVLRGSGSGENGTIINMTGKSHICISLRGNVTTKLSADSTFITDAYVASGTNTFNVADASGYSISDTIRISRPVTEAWVKFMGMHDMVRNEKPQTWITGKITTDRVISKIDKNKIEVSLPLTDNYDSKYLSPPGVAIHKVSTIGMVMQVGIENLRIVAEPKTVTISQGHHRAFTISGVTDAWARNIEVFNTVNSISVTGKRITIDNVSIVHDLPTEGAAKPADLNGSGEQILFNQCRIKGDNLFFFGTGAKVTGPVVLLNCVFKGNGWIQPHQRWATGLLVDNCEVPEGGIDFMNRGSMGSGHGWAIGWAVAWNSKAKSFLNQQPPGAANWVIGSTGEQQKKPRPFGNGPVLTEGIYDSHDQTVDPASLYLSQLRERLGRKAVENIGY